MRRCVLSLDNNSLGLIDISKAEAFFHPSLPAPKRVKKNRGLRYPQSPSPKYREICGLSPVKIVINKIVKRFYWGAQIDTVEKIKHLAEKMFAAAKGSHDWEHTLRVFRLCQRIGAAEKADMDVLLIAACLHDIGRCYQDASKGRICHAEKGAEIAEPLIRPLALSEARKQNIMHCIRSHRFRGNHAPSTIEARILFDADKLDAIGAVGIGRAFLFAGEVGARLHNAQANIDETQPYSKEDTGYREFQVKLSKIKHRIMTDEGKRLAADRDAYMVSFFDRFLLEYEGER